MQKQEGFVGILIALLVAGFLFLILFTGAQFHNEVVSGIAYNTSNDSLIGGNTHFSVRAGENTYVSEENQSSYCLPGNSPYKDVVNKAARDKRVKIEVEAKRYFAIKAPWTCYPNVTVREVK